MIEVSNLKRVFSYGDINSIALGNINMKIDRGEFVAIMGPSGCGKTTLLNILGLLDNPTEGSYLFNGVEVANMKESERTGLRKGKIGFIFQTFNLIDELNVEQNVELPLKYLGVPAAERHEQVIKMLRRVNMSHRLSHFPNQLSGGQQQRVAIARAVVCAPELILADEPTGNLDSANSEGIMKLFDGIHRKGNTVILVTHEEAVARHAGRIVRIRDGKIERDENLHKDR